MAALGPVIGGWLIDLGSWRAIFLLNLPLACAACILAWRIVPHDRTSAAYPLDSIGGILASIGLAALTWALTLGSGRSGWSPTALAAAGVAVLLLLIFWRFETARGARAMMPMHLFASKSFLGLTIFTFLLYGALGGLFVLLPYVLIKAAGYSSTAAGAALLPLPIIVAVTSPAAGALAGRIGTRLPLSVGPLVVAAGFLMALRMSASSSYWTQVLPMILVIALGMSAAVAPLTTAVLTSVAQEHTGSASGLNSAVARTGGLVATALLGSVLAAEGDRLLAAYHAAMGVGALICAVAALSAFRLLART
jgi:predicted MFS family arabinose efflux permease